MRNVWGSSGLREIVRCSSKARTVLARDAMTSAFTVSPSCAGKRCNNSSRVAAVSPSTWMLFNVPYKSGGNAIPDLESGAASWGSLKSIVTCVVAGSVMAWGEECHCNMASSAALRSSSGPLTTFASDTWPSASMWTSSTTAPSICFSRAACGYFGATLCSRFDWAASWGTGAAWSGNVGSASQPAASNTPQLMAQNLTGGESFDHNHGTAAEGTDPHRIGLGRRRCARWCGSGNYSAQELFAKRHKFPPAATGQEAVMADAHQAARQHM